MATPKTAASTTEETAMLAPRPAADLPLPFSSKFTRLVGTVKGAKEVEEAMSVLSAPELVYRAVREVLQASFLKLMVKMSAPHFVWIDFAFSGAVV